MGKSTRNAHGSPLCPIPEDKSVDTFSDEVQRCLDICVDKFRLLEESFRKAKVNIPYYKLRDAVFQKYNLQFTLRSQLSRQNWAIAGSAEHFPRRKQQPPPKQFVRPVVSYCKELGKDRSSLKQQKKTSLRQAYACLVSRKF